MTTLTKTFLGLGLTGALSLLTSNLAADGTCAGAGATCPATAAASQGTCPAGKEACCSTTAPTAAAGLCPAETKLVKVSYQVSGMTCAGCETKVTGALSKIAGVSEPTACAESQVVKLAYDPTKVKEEQLLAALKKTGYKVQSQTVDLHVDGMKCGACSEKVSQKLASVKGVKEQKVCHEGHKAVVTFDPNKVSRKEIIAAIDTTGFKVVQ